MADILSSDLEIAQRIQELISRLILGEATDKDRSELSELSELRSRRMNPPKPERRRQFA